EGVLNAGGNNVFLINPNGVIITKTGTINANRFVASTSSMSDGDMTAFANMKNFNDGLSFSPIFKPQKAGNVVNMGNINANNVLLIGNKVSIDGGHINGKHNEGVGGDALKKPSGNTANKVHLVGNEVNILAGGINSISTIASAYVKGSLQQSTSSYYKDGDKISGFEFNTQEYENIDKTNLGNKKLVDKDKFEKYASIASDVDWFYFAKGWNENKNNMRDFFDTYKLVDDIDFGASEGKNYANYCIDGNNCTNMIVGTTGAFTKTFDGQGYTLSNINIDTTKLSFEPNNVGIFGRADGATFKNIKIDYKGGGIQTKKADYIGGFVGYVSNGTNKQSVFENIILENMTKGIVIDFDASDFQKNTVGGFVGYTQNAKFDKILLQNIGDINGMKAAGGFAGRSDKGEFKNITLKTIGNIGNYSFVEAGGFIGTAKGFDWFAPKNIFDGISLSDIGMIRGGLSGGFAGESAGKYSNIKIDGIKYIGSASLDNGFVISSTDSGGFIGRSSENSSFTNISLNNIGDIVAKDKAGGFIGHIFNDPKEFKHISLNNIGNIKADVFAGGFIGDLSLGGQGYFAIENIRLDDIESIEGGRYAGGFIGYFKSDIRNEPWAMKNIHLFFHENFKINGGEKTGLLVANFEKKDNIVSYENINIYHKENALQNDFTDKNEWNKYNIQTYNNESDKILKYNEFKENAKINDPLASVLPSFSSSEATLDTDDILDLKLLEQIISDLKDKFYVVDINTLNDLLKAYSKIDKDNPASKAEFLANYLLSKDKYPDKEKRLDIAHSMIQNLDFLLAYQNNGLDKASDDKFASKEAIKAKNDILAEVFTASNQANTNKDKVNNFIQYLNNEVNKINSANNKFKEKNYYKDLNDLALAYNKYVELINKGLASKDDQAFKDISDMLFDLIAQAQDETEAIERLIKDFEDLKTQVSKNSNGHFVVTGELSAIKIPYPILASIKDDNGGGEIEIPDKPIDPVEPPIDNKPDDSLVFEQSSTFN
ncbi:filamentous hemagglutinin N-terminal domain-containing protein, partial [Campylobacter lari]|uniref:two-partner secretion domain-containing protein n=1 Tax=Campylobacter lari TaxID=201 RepID=UPI001BD496B9